MKKVRISLYITLGVMCVILGLIGILVPVLPTTPFLLLAAYFFGRSSRRALEWLLHNRWFGVYIRNYREGRGMAARDKAITLLFLWLTILATLIYVVDTIWVQVLLVAVASGVTYHLLRIRTIDMQEQPQQVESAAEPEQGT